MIPLPSFSPSSAKLTASQMDSDSDSDLEDDMIVRLPAIKTIAQLYQSGDLAAAATSRYKPERLFLDRISLFQGDITLLEVDSIVNAANRTLLGGGGVDGAIHAAAGRKLLEECQGLNGCETGDSKITKAYRLPSKHIIHTVGPVYSRSDIEARAQQLESCYKTSLDLAIENNLKHIAFPSISTGIYGYPIEDATHLALDLARRFCETEVGSKLDRIIFVVWSNKDKGVYESLIPEYFPPTSDVAAEEASTPKADSRASVGPPDLEEEAEEPPESQIEEELEEWQEVEGSQDLPEESNEAPTVNADDKEKTSPKS